MKTKSTSWKEKMYTLLAGLIKKKRKKKQIINTRHERGAIAVDLTYINLTVRIYHEWLYTNKYEDLDQTPEWHTL